MTIDLRKKFRAGGKLQRGWRAQAWLKHVTRCAHCGLAGNGQHKPGCVVLDERARAHAIVEALFSNDWNGQRALDLIDSGEWL